MESLKARKKKYKWHTSQIQWYQGQYILHRYQYLDPPKKWRWYRSQLRWHRGQRAEIHFSLTEIIYPSRDRIVENITKNNRLLEKIKNAQAL